MRIAAFLIGMSGTAVAVAVGAIHLGYSGWAVTGFVVGTLVISQMLYLGLILLMTREESLSRREGSASDAPSDKLIPIHKSQQSGL
ncbi:hypothetical protein D1114_02705 [Cereibacter sphaeroides]|uniref:Uncharacterized protein n=1 Tax=Cereibacter sphaeroides TaxID=1063 RepID=A0AAX1UQE3_CERSP|nr:hypothetical protein [Cereibacter sphaeroides]AZB64089.1 hypothetical protein EBL87_10155 [Cereibacter sphaeroides]AZB67990.1 hypothetical protein EBL86_06315 [Cereibacter sphaeroides]RHZ98143.1 hypothetical protein D1114_02705 [Cereibacter sphaeroides]